MFGYNIRVVSNLVKVYNILFVCRWPWCSIIYYSLSHTTKRLTGRIINSNSGYCKITVILILQFISTLSNLTTIYMAFKFIVLSSKPEMFISAKFVSATVAIFLFRCNFTCYIDSDRNKLVRKEPLILFHKTTCMTKSNIDILAVLLHMFDFRLKLEWVKRSRRNLQSSMKNIKRNWSNKEKSKDMLF